MERTVELNEGTRIPDEEEHETLEAQTQGVISAFLGQPVVADTDRIVVSCDWATGALSIAAQPDCPRNVTATLTDADNSCTGTLTIAGEDPDGQPITETMTPDGAGGGKTLTGTKMFAKITSVAITNAAGGTPSTDVVVVGVGNKIGLPVNITRSLAVVHVFLGGARQASPTIATGASTSSVDASAGTYDGAKVLWALLRPSKRV